MCTLDSLYVESYDCFVGDIFIPCIDDDHFVFGDCEFCPFYKDLGVSREIPEGGDL